MKRIVIIQRVDIRKTRKGENFATLTLNLGIGGDFASVDGKIWQVDRLTRDGAALPNSNEIVECDYTEQDYNGARQWVIEGLRRLKGRELEDARALFTQPSRIDRPFYMRRLEELIEQTDPERVSGMALREVFDSGSFRENFYNAPAAKSRHQNYPGGLLEHTLNVTSLALALADAYTGGPAGAAPLTFNCERLPVDRSLLISAGLLHDIGKLDTYRFAPLPDVTDANQFEGHLPIGYAIVREITNPMKASPPHPGAADEVDKLLNCILSHHGTLEFGSPVTPCCVEAVLLSSADIADARFSEIATQGHLALAQNPSARWVKTHHFQQMFIGDWPAGGGKEPGAGKAGNAGKQKAAL